MYNAKKTNPNIANITTIGYKVWTNADLVKLLLFVLLFSIGLSILFVYEQF